MRRAGQGSKWIRQWRRLQIYSLDLWRCVYCERSAFPEGGLTLDHLVPQCLGGTTKNSNLLTCCWLCNTIRHEMPAEQFVGALAGGLGLDTQVVAHRVRSALGQRNNARRAATAKASGKRLASAPPAWLKSLRERSSGCAREAQVDGERLKQRMREARAHPELLVFEGPPLIWTGKEIENFDPCSAAAA